MSYSWDGLIYEKLDRGDLKQLLLLKEDTWQVTHQALIANIEDQNRWFDSLDQDTTAPHNLVLMVKSSAGNRIGIFKIFNAQYTHRSADVAWDVFSDYRGLGNGKSIVAGGVLFCSRILNLTRLNAEILEGNDRSIACAIHAGFRPEGTRKAAVFKDGAYLDSHLFGYVAPGRC